MFSGIPVLTATGKTLLLRAAGGESFTFTKFVAGNGRLSEGELPEMQTALKNTVISSIGITRSENTEDEGYIQLTGSFDNQTDILEDFRWTELGLIAEDEQGNEYLYAYGYEDEYAELIKAGGSSVLAEQTFSIIVAVGDTQNITAYVLPNLTYALKSDLDALEEKVDGLGPEDVGAAAAEHGHSTDDISSGILPVERGGTGKSNLQDFFAGIQTNFKVGTFTGDGKTRKDISLGFKPSAVFIIPVNGGTAANASYQQIIGFAPGKNQYHSGCGSAYLTTDVDTLMNRGHGGAGITNTGFAVGYGSGNRTDINVNGTLYLYFALK